MKLNNVEISFPSLEISSVDDELVIYNPVTEEVMTLNGTASTIWNYIYQFSNTDEIITSDDILSKLVQVYSLTIHNNDDVMRDIEEILQKFLLIGLFVEKS